MDELVSLVRLIKLVPLWSKRGVHGFSFTPVALKLFCCFLQTLRFAFAFATNMPRETISSSHSLVARPSTGERGSGNLRITQLFCTVSKCGSVKWVLTKITMCYSIACVASLAVSPWRQHGVMWFSCPTGTMGREEQIYYAKFTRPSSRLAPRLLEPQVLAADLWFYQGTFAVLLSD